MDVGCFGPFEVLYQAEVKKFTRQKAGTSVTRYDICGLVCKVYDMRALQSDNLRAVFRKTGIYPLEKTVVSEHQLMPSLVFKGKQNELVNVNEDENSEKNNKNLLRLELEMCPWDTDAPAIAKFA